MASEWFVPSRKCWQEMDSSSQTCLCFQSRVQEMWKVTETLKGLKGSKFRESQWNHLSHTAALDAPSPHLAIVSSSARVLQRERIAYFSEELQVLERVWGLNIGFLRLAPKPLLSGTGNDAFFCFSKNRKKVKVLARRPLRWYQLDAWLSIDLPAPTVRPRRLPFSTSLVRPTVSTVSRF